MPLGDALDHRIEALLKDWHHSPDLLYAVHPLDGSFLVWLVELLMQHSKTTSNVPFLQAG